MGLTNGKLGMNIEKKKKKIWQAQNEHGGIMNRDTDSWDKQALEGG